MGHKSQLQVYTLNIPQLIVWFSTVYDLNIIKHKVTLCITHAVIKKRALLGLGIHVSTGAVESFVECVLGFTKIGFTNIYIYTEKLCKVIDPDKIFVSHRGIKPSKTCLCRVNWKLWPMTAPMIKPLHLTYPNLAASNERRLVDFVMTFWIPF